MFIVSINHYTINNTAHFWFAKFNDPSKNHKKEKTLEGDEQFLLRSRANEERMCSLKRRYN